MALLKPLAVSLVCLELLTDPVTQLLSAAEVQGRYKNHGDGSPDHFFTQRSFILSWHTIIIVGAVANLHVWLCRLQARTYSEYSKLFKGE